MHLTESSPNVQRFETKRFVYAPIKLLSGFSSNDANKLLFGNGWRFFLRSYELLTLLVMAATGERCSGNFALASARDPVSKGSLDCFMWEGK